MDMKDVKAVVLGDKEVTQIADASGKVLWKKSSVEYKGLTFTAEQDNSTVKYVNNGSNAPDMQYSMDGENWQAWTADTDITLANGESVYVRGDNAGGINKGWAKYSKFVMTGLIAATGDIRSLIDNGACEVTICPANCFMVMFKDCTSLTSAPKFEFATVRSGAFNVAFQNCTNIKTVESLVCTSSVGSYGFTDMFNGCSNLAEIKNLDLSATAIYDYCYASLFNNTSLTDAPEKLPATTLATGCYQYMFSETKITEAPELPATTLATGCYQYMFLNCKNLLVPPQLPATASANNCYKSMFSGCSKVYVSDISGIPFMKIETDEATTPFVNMLAGTAGETADPVANTQYYYQPSDYAGLTFVAAEDGATVAYTNVGGNSPDMKYSLDGTNWVQWAADTPITLNKGDYLCVKGDNAAGFSSAEKYTYFAISGSMYSYGDIMALIDDGACATTEIPCNNCFAHLFAYQTTLLTAPQLPATTLTINCYMSMFEGCGALTIAPQLPATELMAGCYYLMFARSSMLATPPELPASEAKTACYQMMFYGCYSLKISDSTGTQFMNITIPETATDAVNNMFAGTGGTYTDDPVSGTDYYYE